MFKKLKKILTVALAGVMCLGCGTMAFAATTSSEDTGSITINGLEGGTSASAYQIAEATYDNNGNFLGYEMTVSVADGWSIGSDGSWTDPSESDLATLFAACGNATKTVSISQGQDSITISDLPVGSYLIVIEGSESTVYGMMIGSVSYDVDDDGNWIINNGSISISGSTLWAKATTPSILKEETGGSLDDYEHGGSANVGDTIEYHITVNGIPSYQGSNPKFIVEDKISEELSITDDELANLYIMIDGDESKILDSNLYEVTKTENGFTVDFVVDGAYTLNDYAGHYLVIDFCADVISSTADADDHPNDVVLTYATTSYATGSEGTDEDIDHEYTFSFKALKTDGTAALPGAEFTLYDDSGAVIDTKVSGDDGYFTFTGLEEGTYTMKETKAPAGYQLNQAVYTVEISASFTAADSKMGGDLASWSVVVKNESGETVASSISSADTGLTIINTQTGLLPSMGGRGTLAITLIGCAVVCVAVAGTVASRRRRAA